MLDLNKYFEYRISCSLWIFCRIFCSYYPPSGKGRKPSPLGEDFSRLAFLMKKYRKNSHSVYDLIHNLLAE